MTKKVVTLNLVRKYVRKARDFMRVYRVGLDTAGCNSAKDHVRICKSHRCALDNNLRFIQSDEGDESDVLVPVVIQVDDDISVILENFFDNMS